MAEREGRRGRNWRFWRRSNGRQIEPEAKGSGMTPTFDAGISDLTQQDVDIAHSIRSIGFDATPESVAYIRNGIEAAKRDALFKAAVERRLLTKQVRREIAEMEKGFNENND